MNLKQQLKQSSLSKQNIHRFCQSFQKYLQSTKKNVSDWSNFIPLEINIQHRDLAIPTSSKTRELLQQVVICKLNGGLGTSMGCNQPKSSIVVKENKNFLDIALLQHSFMQKKWQTSIPFLLMNSFYTTKVTKEKIQPYEKDIDLRCITQSCYPRIEELENNNYQLLDEKKFNHKAFYPPGHGDIFLHLQENLLDELLQQKKKYLFLSNIDNLGATIDLAILEYLQTTNCPFLMEVVVKDTKDIKGGSLLKHLVTQKIKLLETAEIENIPKKHWSQLQNKLTTFNTNNLWINLQKLQHTIKKKSWELDLIKNYKTIANKKILQLETTMGSAISNFLTAQIIKVQRNRFLPVKKMSDLELLQSDYFILQKEKGYLLTPKK